MPQHLTVIAQHAIAAGQHSIAIAQHSIAASQHSIVMPLHSIAIAQHGIAASQHSIAMPQYSSSECRFYPLLAIAFLVQSTWLILTVNCQCDRWFSTRLNTRLNSICNGGN